MSGSRITVGLFLCLLSGTLTWAQQTIPVSIFSRNSVPVPDLTNSNFEASYRGKTVRVNSVTEDPGPRRIMLLLDVSGSMLGSTTDADWNFPLDIAEALLIKMPRETEIGMAVFITELGQVISPTIDRQKIMDEVKIVRKSRGEFAKRNDQGTAVWDAIIAAAKLFDHPQVGDAVYVITDGIDNNSKANTGDVVQALACRGVRLFSFQLVDHRKAVRSITHTSAVAVQQLIEITEDTGGFLASAVRPSSADYHTWDFVDKSGNPTGLTAMLFGQYQRILNVYRMSVDLPEHLNNPQNWHLDFAGLDKSAKSELELFYPKKLVSCD
jgi:hypothetical protein